MWSRHPVEGGADRLYRPLLVDLAPAGLAAERTAVRPRPEAGRFVVEPWLADLALCWEPVRDGVRPDRCCVLPLPVCFGAAAGLDLALGLERMYASLSLL